MPTNAIAPVRVIHSGAEDGTVNRWIVFGVCVFLAVITLAIFGQTLRYEFINFDDDLYVYDNAAVAGGLTLKGIAAAFSFNNFDYWIPLTTLSHILDCQLYGLNAGGPHLTNVFLHTASVILLFLILRRMTGALWRAAFVAALFAIHPLRAESVAWVAERKDVLSGFFFMLALWAYARAKLSTLHSSLFTRYWLVLIFFALGLMAKPMVLTLPFVLLLLDYWPLRRSGECKVESGEWKKMVIEKIPLFALALAWCGLTVFAISHAHSIQLPQNLSIPSRISDALVSYSAYLGQMLYPRGLAVPYLRPEGGYPLWKAIAAFLLVAGIGLWAFLRKRKSPYLLVGWLWYLGMLVPVIGLVQAGAHVRADRYTYLPQVGLYIMMAWGVSELSTGWRHRRAVLGSAAVLVIGALTFCTRVQVSYWKDSESLWTHTLACTSGNDVAENNLGDALFKKGQVNESVAHFQKAVNIQPSNAEARNNLGGALLQQGRTNEAIIQLQKAVNLQPDYAAAHNNLGDALFQTGQADEAKAHFLKALKIKPDYADAQNNLGTVLLQKGDVDEAMAHLQRAVIIQPSFARAHYNLGNAFFQKGNEDEAVAQFKKALEIQPAYSDAHYNLGNVLLQKGQVDEALAHFQKALEIQPDNPLAHVNLGNALVQKGQLDEAIMQYQKSMKIRPDIGITHYNYAYALLQKGKLDEATAQYRTAIEIDPNFAVTHPIIQNCLAQIAWTLSTSPDSSIRNGAKAIEIAEQTDRLSGGTNPTVIGALAAAYADAGRFSEAVMTCQRALQQAGNSNNTELASALKEQLKLYQEGSPFRETTKP